MRLPALEIRQGKSRVLYSFAVDGKLLSRFATVSRIRRPEHEALQGYQRPEILSHVAEIRTYLESSDPMIPNAIVVAFDKRVRFEPVEGAPQGSPGSRMGTLVIPVDDSLPDEQKPGWIVDGQQRTAAIREARVPEFPIFVTAFIARTDEEQKEQFILVNSTKPLPKGLIYELLPGTVTKLPSFLEWRRFPAYLLERLNYDDGSPFAGMIQTPTNPEGLVKDNSVLKMLDNSLAEGALHPFRDPRTGRGDAESMLQVVKNFWSAVRDVFPDAWGVPPRQSRLMHGAGLVTLGFLMDAIAERHNPERIPSVEHFAADLSPLRPICRWTTGEWDFGDSKRKWNEIQNTSKDILLLTDYMLGEYKRRVCDRSKAGREVT
jgi:DGQHR domain-containing protein